MKLKKCPKCEEYTLKEICPRCKEKTVSPHPAKFSLQNKYGEYRRQLFKEQEKYK